MKMFNEYFSFIAQQELTTYHYKTLLILFEKPQTQSMICEKLNIRKQNINKIIRKLEQGGFIELDRVEGRNKFYKVVTDIKQINNVLPGQVKF